MQEEQAVILVGEVEVWATVVSGETERSGEIWGIFRGKLDYV